MKHMKWWGWGDEDKEFDLSDKPALWPYIVENLGVDSDVDKISHPAICLEKIRLDPPKRNEPFLKECKSKIYTDHRERVVHSYGKSFRDLLRIRKGQIDRAPDGICYPESEQEVCDILQLAHKYNVVIIPFGGGSNIAGCLEAQGDRMILSMDMRRMNHLLEVDHKSMIARIEAGAMGPDLEKKLNDAGMTLGHFPDSFEYSSLGGWVATRSAGMTSDKYGKIEDMVISLRLATPQGQIITRTVPKSSNGIDVRHLCIGSEGILGVITEVTCQVHPLPATKACYGYLFPDFESGVAAMYECVAKGVAPSMTRLNDPTKTALSFAFKTKGSLLEQFLGKLMKQYLKYKMDLTKVALMLVGYEEDQKKQAHAIYKKHGAVSLGQSPGRSFQKGKYDFPYIRDFVMNRGVIADVSETSTLWSNLLPLYYKSQQAISEAMIKIGVKPYCACHISHTYRTGASLYFTFACKGTDLNQYLTIKKAAEDSFMQNGGTLSHHHGVGYEHMPWMEQEISSMGVTALKALKQGLDPLGIMNPGKIIP